MRQLSDMRRIASERHALELETLREVFAEETAAETAATLRDSGLENDDGSEPRHRFIASDVPEQFLRVGQRFLGKSIDSVETLTLG